VRYMSAFSATLPTFKERISLLYVLNDVLFHSVNTFQQTKSFVAPSIVAFLPAIIKSVQSAADARVDSLDKLFQLWAENKYFSEEEYIQVTGQPAKEIPVETTPKEPERKKLVKPTSLGTHGDPHWLLPVSCMLETMVRYLNSPNFRTIQTTMNLYPRRTSKQSPSPQQQIQNS
jgi:CID domain